MGDHTSMITHIQKSRVYYSSVSPEARQTCNTSKDTACYYFNRDRCYQKTNPNKSYADALKSTNHVPTKEPHNLMCDTRDYIVPTFVKKIQTSTGKTPVNRVNATTCFTKIKKQQYQNPIKLHNRFQALQHIDTEHDIEAKQVCKQIEDVHSKLGVSRPVLDGKSKTPLAGNKNKTGCPVRDLTHNKLACTQTADSDTLSRDVSTQ